MNRKLLRPSPHSRLTSRGRTSRPSSYAKPAETQPSFGLGDKTTQPGPITVTNIAKESAWSEFNADMCQANDLLVKRGIPDQLDLSETFVGGRSNLGYR